ncbi:MAG TPA: electron transfer flavoprotein subunit beta [bacterium]|jgi:electron transfer flavoprotein beta subunit|nr:electron transfer flavoprotein subunit beta [bacterium]HNT66026.1 electron transfer flavoprotein subunit beta [bacterium]
MSFFHIVVCSGVAPDPLQTLLPVSDHSAPALKNEQMLPHLLDPWAEHSLFEAANLAKNNPQSKVWLVSMAPRAKLSQVMMKVAQKASFELVALDAPSNGFTDSFAAAEKLAETIRSIPSLDFNRLLLFGGWESASRASGTTLQMTGELLNICDQFQGVDELEVTNDGGLRVLERLEGGEHQISLCVGPPAVLGWATGNLPEPPNNPQVGMTNMRQIMPALQKAQAFGYPADALQFTSVALPQQKRDTELVKDKNPQEIAREIVDWMRRQ